MLESAKTTKESNMNIDWMAPFKLAFELGMFALGSILLLLIVTVSVVLVFAIIRSAIVTFKRRKQPKEQKEIRKLFSVKP